MSIYFQILDDNRTHLRNLKKSVKGLIEAGKSKQKLMLFYSSYLLTF